MHIPILFQDADIVVVSKPVGIPTHAPDPDDPYKGDALRITQAQTGLAYLGMHQRLDADTSGALLFSARREANRALAAAFEGREVRKVYLALVYGSPRPPAGIIDAPIAREHGERYRIAGRGDPRGQIARTRYRVMENTGTGSVTNASYSWLEIVPETGRPHQIRVHLASIGCPVVGDSLYDTQQRPAPRLCLHAHRLTVPHPATGEPLTFTAPTPALFDRLSILLPALRSAEPVGVLGTLNRMPKILTGLLKTAIERRAPLIADAGTTIYRLVHGKDDGLPGLTLDRFGDALVVGLYEDAAQGGAAPDLRSLAGGMVELTGARSVYIKHRPKEAGRVAEDQLADLAPPKPVYGPDLSELVAHEEGLAYLIRPGAGLSVGLFSDMRETRARVRVWAAGKRVLNSFAYTCAFGVAALAGGAERVLNLDLSKSALEWGKANYQANGCAIDDHDFVYGDVFDWLARLAKRGDRFDLVILDPPGFSRTKTRRFSAEHDYGELAALAAKVTQTDGLLLACCNVAELPRRAFRDRVLAGLTTAGRKAEIVGAYHEPAVDFPASMGDSPYLKILALRLD